MEYKELAAKMRKTRKSWCGYASFVLFSGYPIGLACRLCNGLGSKHWKLGTPLNIWRSLSECSSQFSLGFSRGVKSLASTLPVRRSFRAKVDALSAIRHMESSAITTKELKALKGKAKAAWVNPNPRARLWRAVTRSPEIELGLDGLALPRFLACSGWQSQIVRTAADVRLATIEEPPRSLMEEFPPIFLARRAGEGLPIHRSLIVHGWLCHPAVASAGNLVKFEGGCATVTGYNLPRPLGPPCGTGKAGVRSDTRKSGHQLGYMLVGSRPRGATSPSKRRMRPDR
jgi:hypothetical protein